MNEAAIRVVIADDHILVRQGIRAFLDTHGDLNIVGEAEDAAGAIELCRKTTPQVALIDLVMPGGGITAIREIRKNSPQVHVMVLTSFDDAAQIIAAVQAGALSCMLKDVDADTLADAIRRTAQGEAVLHPRAAGYLMDALRNPSPTPGAELLEALSDREREVLTLLAEGLSNQQISDRLEISSKTVKTHVSNILAKLGVNDRTQAAVYAWKSGMKQN